MLMKFTQFDIAATPDQAGILKSIEKSDSLKLRNNKEVLNEYFDYINRLFYNVIIFGS